MKKHMNLFSQRIGIWYTDKDDMIKVFNIIIKNINNEYIVRCVIGHDSVIELKDGTVIKFFECNNRNKGVCVSESYVIKPENISKDFINCVVKPVTKIGSRNVYALDSLEENDVIMGIKYNRKSI